MSQLYDTAKKAYWRVRGLGVQPPPSVPARGYTGRIQSIAFLSDGGRLIGGSDDGSVRAWKAESRNGTPTKMTDGGAVYAVAASSDGRRIATAGAKKIITIWDATTYEKVVELTGHSSEVTEVRSLAFSPDSARVVSGLDGGRVFVWSTTTSKPLAQLQGGGHIGLVSSVCFSPSGEEIASCDMQDIRLWQSHSGELGIQPIQSVKAHSLVWPSNDKRLIAGCNDGSIKIFDASTGSLLAQWKGHTAIVHSIAVSHDGKWLASGSGDKTVRLWYTHTRQQIGRGLRHNSEVYSVVISPDGRHLASGGDNNKVSIWAPPASLLENTPTTSNSVPGNVHDEELHPQQVLDPPKEVQMSQSPKDDHNDENMAGKDESEGLATVLQRRSSESSSLRDFLDRSAVPPSIGGAEGPSDQVYSNFFKTDSLDVRDIGLFHLRSHIPCAGPTTS
ncbi:WD40 repeat-like protein [Paxillus ammoniavirescens]|nr:WD40 repeat-like protein [Paxillus ammoniavirescens]